MVIFTNSILYPVNAGLYRDPIKKVRFISDPEHKYFVTFYNLYEFLMLSLKFAINISPLKYTGIITCNTRSI